MKLSVKSEYAVRAVLGLARHYATGAAVRAESLAAENGIPPNYLVQILIELKAQQIVRSHRGKDGGYSLARTPADITFGQVLRSVHGQVFESPGASDPASPPELKEAWRQLQAALDAAADAINFQGLLEQGASKEKMYYI